MKKSFFEQKGIIYTQTGDYLLPDVELPAEEERQVGIWGQRRLRYLKQHRRILYCNLLTSGKLHSHLADIEEQAQALFSRLVEAICRQGRGDRDAQGTRLDGVGGEDEQHSQPGDGGRQQ